ncbi:MAG: glycosyltransferase [Chloroflexi bacterium]|nr:glycosyltransferase [Chloroflexota bacterium]
MRVSVIVTVKNEGASIRGLLDSLAAQSRAPDEVVIVDGGSGDDTVAQMEAYADRLPLRVSVAPGANISRGRNLAIAMAQGDVIASTDAGVRLSPGWLAALTEPFASPETAVVSGFFVADPQGVFELAMGATVLPHLADVRPETFLPSSRSVAFRKAAWQAVGGYPEWLDFCEDLIFDLRLQARHGSFPFVPEAVARFRPRGSLRSFWRQYWQYARGDGKANLWLRRHLIRYGTYLVAGPTLLFLALRHHPAWLLALAVGAAAYLWPPYRRLGPALGGLPLGQKLAALLWVPVIRVVGDLAKMGGYPVGVLWRWRHRQDPELHWQEDSRVAMRD